ncbi:hypothetical protein [Streptomyces sp. NPDC051132]
MPRTVRGGATDVPTKSEGAPRLSAIRSAAAPPEIGGVGIAV